MADDARKKALEQFTRDVMEGLPFAEDYINKDSNIERNSLKARALAEEALANQVLKNTGISIPGREASRAKQEDFLAQMMKERYPELDPNIRVLPDEQIKNILGKNESVSGYYTSKYAGNPKPSIVVNEQELLRGGPSRGVGTLFHEAGHQYDDRILNLNKATKELDIATLRKLVADGVDLKNMDPAQVYELYAKEHHAQIPKLREGTFGLGALKSYLKSGDFRGVTGPAGAMLQSLKDLYTDAPAKSNPAETKYAEQKTGLLPSWATEDLEKIENSKLSRLHGISTVAARALGPLAIGSSIVPLAADVKEGKYNTALARAASYAAPVGAEDMTANLMQEAELRDKSPELFDPEYRKLLQRIGQKRVEQGKSPVVESFSGQPVDTSATEESDIENRIKALQNLKSQG